ncbi:MAG: IS30 family transposase [Verrucomicrobiales bacterium]
MIGKLANKTVAETSRRLQKLIDRHPGNVRTITADNGCEFHGNAEIEESHRVEFYFAPPYHSWERGTNENTNGLIQQYLPQCECLEHFTLEPGDIHRDEPGICPRAAPAWHDGATARTHAAHQIEFTQGARRFFPRLPQLGTVGASVF